MYRERKDLELAKTVTHSRLLYMKNGPVPSTKLTPSRTQNRGYLYYSRMAPQSKAEVFTMKKYDLSQIMTRAWQLYRKGVAAFAECLHRAWMAAKAAPINAQRIEESRQAFGVTEEVHTWADWHKLGFEVVHGSRCLFQCPLIQASKGDGQTYKASFFGVSQVQPLAQQ